MVLHVGKAETGGSLWLVAKLPHLLGERPERDPVLRKKWWTVTEEQHLLLPPWFPHRHLDSQTRTFIHIHLHIYIHMHRQTKENKTNSQLNKLIQE